MKNLFKSKPSHQNVIYFNERSEQTAKLHSFDDIKQIISREKARSDRNNHEFSVIVIDLETGDQENGIMSNLCHRLNSRLRLIDEIGWYDKNNIAIVLPYTSSENAVRVADELVKIISADIPAQLSKILSYPSVWPYKK